MPLLSNETPARLTLQTFHKDFGERKVELTASVVNSEPWFRAKEVAAALGFKYVRSAIETHVDEEDLTTMKALGLMTAHESRSHACEGVYISANGLCSLVIGSRKSDAKAIGRWVWKEVLPAIRRNANLEDEEEDEEEDEADNATTAAVAIVQPTEEQHWQCLRAKLDALTAAHNLARAAGVPTGEGLQKAIADGVNSVMLPAGRQQGDMMDAADYLRRRGHTEDEINHIAGEFGKALKAAWEQLRGEDVVTNAAEFGSALSNVRKYHAQDDAMFMDEVYNLFKAKRALYSTICAGHEEARAQTADQVAAALQNARGFKQPAPKRQRIAATAR